MRRVTIERSLGRQRFAALRAQAQDDHSYRAERLPRAPRRRPTLQHLRGTVKVIRYDKRLRLVELRLDLDPQLPAIQGIPDQLTQLIMNLLINALDAVEDVQSRPSPSARSDSRKSRRAAPDSGSFCSS